MQLRREIMSYVGAGAIGGIAGYYAGATELLGIQSETSPPEEETETPSSEVQTDEQDQENTQTEDSTDTETSTSERVALSFEDATVGSSSLPDSWYVMRESGSMTITDNSSEGDKAIQLVSQNDLEPIAVGVDIDLTGINQILADMYPTDVSPNYGFVKFLLDEPDRSNGHIHTRDHPGRTAHGGQHTEAFRDEEWHRDIEFFRSNGNAISDISGTHTLILHTSGSNNVIWDNIRFQDASGDMIQLQEVLV